MRLHSLFVLALTLLCPLPALAEGFGHFTARVPVKWQAFPEGSGVLFQPRDKSHMVFVSTQKMDVTDPIRWAQDVVRSMGMQEMRALTPKGPFVFTAKDGGRGWLAIQGETILRISVEPKAGDIPTETVSLLQSIAPGPDYPEFSAVISQLNASPAVIQWLAGTGPEPEGIPIESAAPTGLPDFANLGNRDEDTAPPPTMPTLPDGWTATTAGHWAVATSADGMLVIAMRTYWVAEADLARETWPLEATAKDLVGLLGGSNLYMAEGDCYFTLPPGEVVVSRGPGNTVDIVFYNEIEALYLWNGIL